ncbi:hypothetical protein BGX26_006525, partial [Mortierella sp. AD094]
MAYADDLLCLIKSAEEWTHLKEILATYGRASNAKLNLSKTVAFPLYKGIGPLAEALQADHVQIHSDGAEDALVYLGFPIALKKNQRESFFNNIHKKIKQHVGMLEGRQLSVQG